MPETNYCGRCKHWHKRDEQMYSIDIGDCDKIPKGMVYQDGKDYAGFPFTYDGYSFEDECYDECMNCFEPRESEQMAITDRYGNALKTPEQKPTLQQSIDAWALLNELLALGYPHNFQNEAPHISNYMFDISALIDKAFAIKREEVDEWRA